MDKKIARRRRALRTRVKIKELAMPRLCIHRTPCHIYAQIIAPTADRTLACTSTLDKAFKSKIEKSGNVEAAKWVGKHIAELGTALGIKRVAFDRSGFRYHGRIEALAEAAREGGLEF